MIFTLHITANNHFICGDTVERTDFEKYFSVLFQGQHGVLVSFWQPECETQQPHTPLTWKRWLHFIRISQALFIILFKNNECVCIKSHLSCHLICFRNNPNGSREPLTVLCFQGLGSVITAGTAGGGSDAWTRALSPCKKNLCRYSPSLLLSLALYAA